MDDTPNKIENVKWYSLNFLADSNEVFVDRLKVFSHLIPRLKEYQERKNLATFKPIGSNLPYQTEVGLNLFFNVVNFCYQHPWCQYEYSYALPNGSVLRRSAGLLSALAESGIDWNDFKAVSSISVPKWEKICQLSKKNYMYLGSERGVRIVCFAKYLLNLKLGNIDQVLQYCNNDAVSLVELLARSEYFDDLFLKRAQLAARMINDVILGTENIPLQNMGALTVMADYRIPQIFYNLDGVVDLEQNLLNHLKSNNPIRAGSKREVALRATAVIVGEMVAQYFGITEAEADTLLWGLSQEMVKRGEMKIPHMLVATDAY